MYWNSDMKYVVIYYKYTEDSIAVYLSGEVLYRHVVICAEKCKYLRAIYRVLNKVYNQGPPGKWFERWILQE